jgi:hypothetical protein
VVRTAVAPRDEADTAEREDVGRVAGVLRPVPGLAGVAALRPGRDAALAMGVLTVDRDDGLMGEDAESPVE